METALLKCHKFSCEPEGFSSLVERLSLMVRGIANPVVAAYARMYLIHTVQQGNTNCKCARLDEEYCPEFQRMSYIEIIKFIF